MRPAHGGADPVPRADWPCAILGCLAAKDELIEETENRKYHALLHPGRRIHLEDNRSNEGGETNHKDGHGSLQSVRYNEIMKM